jgi:cyclophilin family peptidyl-prolyl cis-trans isomerase
MSLRLRLSLLGLALSALLSGSSLEAANTPPERFLALPDLSLAQGADAVTIALADHLRDPDVPGTAVRLAVRIGTATRTLDLALHDSEAPLSVANFLAYVSSGRYQNNFFHRSVSGFVIQNGGYYFPNDTTFDYVSTYDPVPNEPGRSNLRGTVAMAKLGGDPDSATSQWFINLGDNSANLDEQNGGFTVFAHVLESSMSVVDEIAAVTVYNAGGFHSAWNEIPLTTGTLARANFIETSASVVDPLSHQVSSSAPSVVAATLDAGTLVLTPAANLKGSATITVTSTDLEGGSLASTFTVTVTGRDQTITFTTPADRPFGAAPFTPTATSSSGLPVSISVVSGPASIDPNGLLSLTGGGVVLLRATQSGNEVYAAAEPVERSFTVSLKEQFISVSSLPVQRHVSAPLDLASYVSSTSGLPVSITVSGPASLVGTLLTPTGEAGEVELVFSQPGNTSYRPAQSAKRTLWLIAHALPQGIDFPLIEDTETDLTHYLWNISATSGLPVSIEHVSGPVSLSPEGGSFYTLRAGTVILRARQDGGFHNGLLYEAATPVERRFEVGPPRAQTITVAALPSSVVYGHAGISLAFSSVATASSGGFVTIQVVSGPAIIDDERMLKFTGPGAVTLRFAQDGGTFGFSNDIHRYAAAPTVERTITVTKAPLVVRADSFTRAVGSANPALTYACEGLVGSDTPASAFTRKPAIRTSATRASRPGEYPITLSGGASANYALSLAPGLLTVVGFGGAYEELLRDSDSRPLGKLVVTVSADSLSYSGSLALSSEAEVVPIKGVLTPSEDFATASHVFSRPAGKVLPALAVSFTVSAHSITGDVTRGGVALGFFQEGSRLGSPGAPSGAGAHTIILTPEAVPGAPAGFGHATATLAANGRLTLSGKLPDGAVLTAGLAATPDRIYRLWTNPYSKRLGSFVAGQFRLEAHPDSSRSGRFHIPADTQSLHWEKAPSVADKTARSGIGPVALDVALDPWIPPAAKSTAARPAGTLAQRIGLAADATSGGFLDVLYGPDGLDLGEHADFVPTRLALDKAGRFSVAAPLTAPVNITRWTILSMNPATGAVSGSFVLTDQIAPAPAKPARRTVNFSGVLRQPPASESEPLLGAGFFLLPVAGASAAEQSSAAFGFVATPPAP